MTDLTRIIRNNKLVKVGLQDPQTIAADVTTPDVSTGDVFTTTANTGGTAITDLVNPRVGSIIHILGGSSTNASTIADSGNFTLSGAITFALNTFITLYIRADNDYVEMARSVN